MLVECSWSTVAAKSAMVWGGSSCVVSGGKRSMGPDKLGLYAVDKTMFFDLIFTGKPLDGFY